MNLSSDDRPAPLPKVPGFELERELGRGGAGVVYRAKQLDLGRTVALKMLLSKGHSSSADLQRFQAEAEAMAILQHPNLVTVFQIGQHDGMPFIVMEYLNGGTLAQRFRDKSLDRRAIVELAAQVADAVGYCHAHGIIHRDLKPANILFGEDGRPKVSDFGMAKRLDSATDLTTTGTMLGTPNYMAPEQTLGQSKLVNAPADVWALGVLLYEGLLGRKPFAAETLWETLDRVQKGQFAAPHRLQAGFPEDLERIVLKCLQVDPARRYPTAKELAQDLGNYLRGTPVDAEPLADLRPESQRRGGLRKSWPFALITLTMLLLIMRGYWSSWFGNSVTTPTTANGSVSSGSPTPPTNSTPATSSTPGPTPAVAEPPPGPTVEVAPMPLTLPSPSEDPGAYARRIWWDAVTARPLVRREKLLNIVAKSLDEARNRRDGQTARHVAWLALTRLHRPSPDLAQASKDLALALQAPNAEQEPLIPLLRLMIEREKLLSSARLGQPLDQSANVGNLAVLQLRTAEAVSKLRGQPDRADDLALVTGLATRFSLELTELDSSDVRQNRYRLKQAAAWLASTDIQRWPELQRVLWQSERLRLEGNLLLAEQLSRERLALDPQNPELWRQRGLVLTAPNATLEQLQDAEKAFIQVKKWLEPTEGPARVECLYWLGHIARRQHRLQREQLIGLEFDPTYQRAVTALNEGLNLISDGSASAWYDHTLQELILTHAQEATRPRLDPSKARLLLTIIDRHIRRPDHPLREVVRGYFQWHKERVSRSLKLPPSGASYLADELAAVDLMMQPADAPAQDQVLKAEVLLAFARQLLTAPAEAKALKISAVEELERAAQITDQYPNIPVLLKAEIAAELALQYAALGQLDRARLVFRRAIESDAAFPNRSVIQWEYAKLLKAELTAVQEPSRELVTQVLRWNLIREAEQAKLSPEVMSQIQEEIADYAEIRVELRKPLQAGGPLAEADRVLAELAILEMDVVRGTPRQQQEARDQIQSKQPYWAKLLSTWPDDPRRDQLRDLLNRASALAKSPR